MSQILFSAESVKMPVWKAAAETYIKQVLDFLKLKNWELSVLFCNNRYIKELNAQFGKKDEATDVLSFPLGEMSDDGYFLAGDIVISLDALEENVRLFNVSQDEELRRLLIHGMLHLNGYDHATNETEEPMLQLQEKILDSLAEAKITEKII